MIKKVCAIEGTVEEFRIVKKAMPIISFIRLESAGKSHSKSKMINQLLGINHNYFFHREIGGSSTKSYLLPGTIEIGWYLPKKKGPNAINQHMTFLNLRGNSLIYPNQILFLEKVSTMIFIYVSLNRMTELEWQFLNEQFFIHGSKFVLVIEEKPSKPKYNLKELRNLKNDKKNCILLTENLSNDKDRIIESINYYTENNTAERYCIEKSASVAKGLGILLESESVKELDLFPLIIENIFNPHIENVSQQLSTSNLKSGIFKLQGKWWRDWSNSRRQENRIQVSIEGIESIQAKIQREMKQSRINQVEHLWAMETSILHSLVMHLTNDLNDMEMSLIFFRTLKLYLENLALYLLPKLYESIKVHNSIIHQEKNEDWMIVSLKDIMVELTDQIHDSSLGEEHIMREFAQIYESSITVSGTSQSIQNKDLLDMFSVRKLPIMAARFLLSGIPLEILDGDVSQVPITWIKSVFQEIGNIVGVNKKVYIVSILGIQSSGKSTLLNTMFGLQFPVSAGRCTKGAFMQLVPIDQSTSLTLGYDYLMIIDTEGLKGMEKRNSSSHLHDNELATFAVGLANLTVININGEDQSDMHDILQITIYALIRMKEVELNPKCIFIHQNIVSDSADDKLITQRNKLVDLLNEMTIAAANQENLTVRCNRFSDVIGFDTLSDVLYFSGLLQGEPPMAPINLGYCLDAEEARKIILTKFIKSSEFYRLTEVGKRIDEIWCCIMREDFVFHFRNVLELNVNLELEMELARWESTYTQDLTNWECKELNKLSNLSGKSLEKHWVKLIPLLNEKCQTLRKTQEQEIMTNFFENHKSKDILKDRQYKIETFFVDTRDKQFENIHKNFERIYKNYHHGKSLDKMLNEVENKLLQDIYELYRVHKNQGEEGQFDDEIIREIFLDKWVELSRGFPTQTNKPIDIKLQLQTFFHSTETLKCIKFYDKKMAIGERETFEEFGLKSELDIQKAFHYNKIRKTMSVKLTAQRGKKRDDIRVFLFKVQKDSQELIKSKFTSESNFSENAFKWILDFVDNSFTKRNKENIQLNTRERNYTLTKNLVHDFAFFQCCKLIPQFEEMQKAFLEKNSIKREVENKKEKFENYFFSLWRGVQNEQCAANELATLIFTSISKFAQQSIERNVVPVFKEHNNQFITKYELQLNVLIELCEKENFVAYLLYLQDPIEYLRNKMEEQLYAFYSKDARRNIISETYNQNVINLIATTVNAALQAHEQIHRKVSINESDEIVCPKDKWKNTFLELIKEEVPHVSNTKLAIFDAYEIKDYNAFIQAFSECLSEKQKNDKVEITKEYKIFSKQIMNTIIQCRECCPYCGELCQLNSPSHEHSCGVFHRPLGLMGIKNSSDELISRACPNLVTKSGTFNLLRSKFANLDFRESYLKTKNWKIHQNTAIDTQYWIWVMNRFRTGFEEYFEAPLNIQEASVLTKGDILLQLKDKLDTNCDSSFYTKYGGKKSNLSQMVRKFFFFFFH